MPDCRGPRTGSTPAPFCGTVAAMPKRIRAASREKMVMMNVGVPRELHRQMTKVRAETGVTLGEQLRRAMAEWLARHARQGK